MYGELWVVIFHFRLLRMQEKVNESKGAIMIRWNMNAAHLYIYQYLHNYWIYEY